MKTYLRAGLLISILIPLRIAAAAGESSGDDFYRDWVEFQDGEVSIAFDHIPVQFALHAIHAKTGFQIVIPSTTETRVVNLKLHRQPLEPAVRSLISTIGFKNFALMYDDKGRPHRAVVLSAQPKAIDENAAAEKSESGVQLTVEERDNLQKNLARWAQLKQEERGRIEDRLKNLPASDEREELVTEYGRQVLGLTKSSMPAEAIK